LQHFRPTNRDFDGCRGIKDELRRNYIENYAEGNEAQIKAMMVNKNLSDIALQTRRFHERNEGTSHSEIYHIIEFLEDQQQLKAI